jgi:hypothetical protein
MSGKLATRRKWRCEGTAYRPGCAGPEVAKLESHSRRRKRAAREGMSKTKAVKLATRLVEKNSRPAIVLIHKTRYIVERALQFSQ